MRHFRQALALGTIGTLLGFDPAAQAGITPIARVSSQSSEWEYRGSTPGEDGTHPSGQTWSDIGYWTSSTSDLLPYNVAGRGVSQFSTVDSGGASVRLRASGDYYQDFFSGGFAKSESNFSYTFLIDCVGDYVLRGDWSAWGYTQVAMSLTGNGGSWTFGGDTGGLVLEDSGLFEEIVALGPGEYTLSARVTAGTMGGTEGRLSATFAAVPTPGILGVFALVGSRFSSRSR